MRLTKTREAVTGMSKGKQPSRINLSEYALWLRKEKAIAERKLAQINVLLESLQTRS